MFQRLFISGPPVLIGCAACLLLCAFSALSMPLDIAGTYVSAQSTTDRAALSFSTTVRQRYDYSCGAAALATLLVYHYGSDISEEQVMTAMLRRGDPIKIRSEGFSMLDMKKYLDDRGYDSAGYEVSLDRLAEIGLPGIVLISPRGLNHFVVLKGISQTDVLVGDPVLGIRAVPRSSFDDIWNGMVFIIRNLPDTGRNSFNRRSEWEAARDTVAAEWPGMAASGEADAPPRSVEGMMVRAGRREISR